MQLPPFKSSIVITKWRFPVGGRVKLNTDGCSKRNPGESGGGCVLRNDKGTFIWAIADYYGAGSNMKAEVLAML